MQELSQIRTLGELFEQWKNKVSPKDGHDSGFNEDGIIDADRWNTLPQDRRILFVLKETNELEGSLTQYLNGETAGQGGVTYGTMWHRLAEWYHAMQGAQDAIPTYAWMDTNKKVHDALRNVAVMNLKKVPGTSQAVNQEIVKAAHTDQGEILREIELIDPAVMVFCGTAWHWNQAYQKTDHAVPLDGMQAYAWHDLGGRKRLLIDFYHPANRSARAVIGFYALAAIYCNALENQPKQGLPSDDSTRK